MNMITNLLVINSAEGAVETVAQADLAADVAFNLLTANNIWMMLATALVFIMHLGFAGVEAGFGQAKNTVNILFKNTLTPIIGILTYFLVGFNLMYPDFSANSIIGDWLGFAGFGLSAPLVDGSLDLSYNGGYTYWTDF
jgi:ammonium transporter, Amt family